MQSEIRGTMASSKNLVSTLIGKHRVLEGDAEKLFDKIPESSVDVIVTSPPYWGQRTSDGVGVEEDPRHYVKALNSIFAKGLRVLKPSGVLWINIGDAYNTPVNWREEDHVYSSLGADKVGLSANNSAYKKNRQKRRAFLDKNEPSLRYGNLLALPFRLVISLVDSGFFYRGEVIWRKENPLPEGRCRRPHRVHEPIYLLAKGEDHLFQVSPPVKSVWEFANEGRKESHSHFSRFPEELPKRCIISSGVKLDETSVILDPFAGSGTTGVVAKRLGCSFIGFEIDPKHAASANSRISATEYNSKYATSVLPDIPIKKKKDPLQLDL
jgi:DNA modification methylase